MSETTESMIERLAVVLWHRFGSPSQIEWLDDDAG